MTPAQFLARVLPASGNYCLFQNKEHTWFTSIADLAAAAEQRGDTPDLYFGTASFGDKISERTGMRARTQANVLQRQAFHIDIDCGDEKYAKDPEKTYPSQSDGLAGLGAAIKAGFPRPTMIIRSGTGLHLYFQLQEPCPAAEWVMAATKLKAAAKAVGLRQDPKCTADSARVLRPVGSLHKCGVRVDCGASNGPVYADAAAFAAICAELLPEEDAFDVAAAAAPASMQRSINDDVLAYTGPPASLAQAGDHCAALAHVRDTGGVVPEPLWRGMIGVGKYCEIDGLQVVHQWSAGDARYDRHETQAKYDGWNTPPTTCKYFAEEFAGCAKCSYFGKITTPKQLGYQSAPAVADDVQPVPDVAPPQDAAALAASAMAFAAFDTGESMPPVEAPPAEPSRATDKFPLRDREDLIDESRSFFYKINSGHWTLYANTIVNKKDPTGKDVATPVILPIARRMVWVESGTEHGAVASTGSGLTTLGRVDRVGGTVTYHDMPADSTASADSLVKFLHGIGVFADPSTVNAKALLLKFITLEQIRTQNIMKFVARTRFGYHTYKGHFICAYGRLAVFPTGAEGGDIQTCVVSNQIDRAADWLTVSCLPPSDTGRWDGSVWANHVVPAAKTYCNFIKKHYGHAGFENARLALALCLASPYMAFATDTPFHGERDLPSAGLVVALHSNLSGRGKTHLQHVAARAFGRKDMLNSGKKGALTYNAAMTLAANLGVFPFMLDEMTQDTVDNVANFVDTFSNGQGKIRASRDGVVRHAASTWALITCTSTNKPQRDLLRQSQKSSDALSVRLLELNFDGVPDGDRAAYAKDVEALEPTRGALGLLLAELIVKQGPERMNAMLRDYVDQAFALLNVPQEYRFFARGLACVLALKHQMQGLFPFDINELIASFKAAVGDVSHSNAANATDPEDQLSSMLQHLAVHTAVTEGISDGRREWDVQLNRQFRPPLLARAVLGQGVTYINTKAVHEWCTEQQISVAQFLRTAGQSGFLVLRNDQAIHRRRINAGIQGEAPVNVKVYTFRVSPPAEIIGGS